MCKLVLVATSAPSKKIYTEKMFVLVRMRNRVLVRMRMCFSAHAQRCTHMTGEVLQVLQRLFIR